MRNYTIKELMNQRYNEFDPQQFIKQDPIQIVHAMRDNPAATIADIEVCAMWTAMFTWDNNTQTRQIVNKLMKLCDNKPAEYVKYGDFYDIADGDISYRTTSTSDFKKICHTLRAFYNKYESVQAYIATQKDMRIEDLIIELADTFAPARLGSPARNSACKRICLLLRWMVRKDSVDIGLWRTKNITPAHLYAIMSPTIAKQAHNMALITYSPNSWRAVLELTAAYREWFADDPLRFDLALSFDNKTTHK